MGHAIPHAMLKRLLFKAAKEWKPGKARMVLATPDSAFNNVDLPACNPGCIKQQATVTNCVSCKKN